MHLGPIGGYIITVGGYSAPLKQHRENPAYLVYIKDNIGQPGVTEAEMAQLLIDCVVVVTKNQGPKCLGREVVHFISEYKPEEGDELEAMFPGDICSKMGNRILHAWLIKCLL